MVNGLAPDTFSIVSFRGREAMSSAYSFRIVAAATVDGDEIEQRALGQSAILMWTVGSSIRAFYGVIASLRVGASLDAGRAACQVHFVPRLWLLKRKRRTRIFQKMRVLDVVTSVLLEAGIAARWQLSKVYPVRDYCTQYEETDYAFVTRLLAEAGIYFYFPAGGPVDDALAQMSTIVGAAGSVGSSVVGAVAGSPAGAVVGSVASLVSAILPGDTVICGDDAAFYPPIGADDPTTLAASTTIVLAGAAVGAATGGAGVAMSPLGDAVGGAAAIAGAIVGALASRAAPPLEFLLQDGTMTSHADKVTRFALGTSTRATAAEFRDYDPARPLTKLSSRALSVAPFPESGLKTLASIATSLGGEISVSASGVVGDVGAAVSANVAVAGTALEAVLGDHPPPYLEVYDHHGPFLFPKWTLPSDEAPRMLRQSRRRASIARGAGGCADLATSSRSSVTRFLASTSRMS